MADIQVFRLIEPRRMKRRLDRWFRTDYFLVTELSDPDNMALPQSAGLPKEGTQAFGDGTIVYDVDLVATFTQTAPFTNLYRVESQKQLSYVGVRKSASGGSEPIRFPIPNWTKDAPTVGPPLWVQVPDDQQLVLDRARQWRSKVIQKQLSSDDEIIEFDSEHVGKLFSLSGVDHLYMGTRYTIDQSNQATLSVNFFTTGKIPAIAKNKYPGYSVDVPALDHLEEYVLLRDGPGRAEPSIGVSPPSDRYLECPPIPWLP